MFLVKLRRLMESNTKEVLKKFKGLIDHIRSKYNTYSDLDRNFIDFLIFGMYSELKEYIKQTERGGK